MVWLMYTMGSNLWKQGKQALLAHKKPIAVLIFTSNESFSFFFLSPQFAYTSLSLFSINIVLLWSSWWYAENFTGNYQSDRWNGSVVRWNERLSWWYSQRVRLHVCCHVTNIRLKCCYAQAHYAKGHLTSIAGSNLRPIQLNLFAISILRSMAGCASGAASAKICDIFYPSLPNDCSDKNCMQYIDGEDTNQKN